MSEVEELLKEMERGLTPAKLNREQVQMLEKTYGNDWFKVLGYEEDYFERSAFDSLKKKGEKKRSRLDNLLNNMEKGLLPSDLTQDEVYLLHTKIGPNWFQELGYNEEEHSRSVFDEYKPQKTVVQVQRKSKQEIERERFVEYQKEHPIPNGGHRSWAAMAQYYKKDKK